MSEIKLGKAVMVFLLSKGRILLQLRDDIPNIHFPGKIASFGGSVETGETSKEAALREIQEEIENYIPPNLEYFASTTDGEYDYDVFLIYDDNFELEEHKILEGQKGVWMNPEKLDKSNLVDIVSEMIGLVVQTEKIHSK